MAEVYVGVARGVGGFEKLVALKLIHEEHGDDDDFARMLIDEAKLTVLLTHANIAQTFDLGCVDGRFYIVMEYVDGVDLSRLLDRVASQKRELPIEAALFIANRICQALDYAHRKTDPMGRSLNVIHRDVSPQNVLLGREGDVKLTDFGIAKAALRNSETEVGVIKGKYCYMSPEQAWADPIDQRSDIFSAGAVLYELLTGHMLFSPDDNLPTLLEKVRKAEVDPPSARRPDVPPELDAIVLRALAKKPDDRYETAADLAFDLERQLWFRDRTWGAARLKLLMNELVPSEVVDLDTGPTGRTAVTKIEGQIGKMDSREFVPESSTSILFQVGDLPPESQRRSSRPTDPSRRSSVNGDAPRRSLRPSVRPSAPSTVKHLVEERSESGHDPRVESAVPAPRFDDEEEATTFFSKSDVSLEAALAAPPVPDVASRARAVGASPAGRAASPGPDDEGEDDATLIDTSGDLSKQLEDLVSLGGVRPVHAEPDTEEMPAVRRSFRPPEPAWKPLPFVGPPLDESESGRAIPAIGKRTRADRRVLLVALAVAALVSTLALASLFATR